MSLGKIENELNASEIQRTKQEGSVSTQRVNLAEQSKITNAEISDEMVTQRVNQRSLHLEEEQKQAANVGIMSDLLSNNEATQNINIISNFQPDMTANFVP